MIGALLCGNASLTEVAKINQLIIDQSHAQAALTVVGRTLLARSRHVTTGYLPLRLFGERVVHE